MEAHNMVHFKGAVISASLIQNITNLQIDTLTRHIESVIVDKLTKPNEDENKAVTKSVNAAIGAQIGDIENILKSLVTLTSPAADVNDIDNMKKLASLLLRLEEKLRNTDVTTAEAKKCLAKLTKLRSEVGKLIEFEKSNTKTISFRISDVSKISDSTYPAIGSSIKESLETYFNLPAANIKVSDATASPGNIFTYIVTLKVSNIMMQMINSKVKALMTPPATPRSKLMSDVKSKVVEKFAELKDDVSHMALSASIAGIDYDTEINKFHLRAKALTNEIELAYISDLKLRKNKPDDGSRIHRIAYKPLSRDDLLDHVMSGVPINDVDSLLTYAAIACRGLSKLTGVALENAKQKCSGVKNRLAQYLKKEKSRSSINISPNDSQLQMKVEKENEAEIKEVDRQEKQIRNAFEKEQDENMRGNKEISFDSLKEQEQEKISQNLEIEEENLAENHHELLKETQKIQKSIRDDLANGNKDAAEKKRKTLKALIAKLAVAEKKLVDTQNKNRAAQQQLEQQRKNLQQAKIRMKELELKEKEAKKMMQKLDEQRQEKIKERLNQRQILHQNILSLKRDTGALESQIQNGAGLPALSDVSNNLDMADQQAYAKQKIEELVKGFSNVVIAKMNSQPVPTPVAPNSLPVPSPSLENHNATSQINIVIGCGKDCQKNKDDKSPPENDVKNDIKNTPDTKNVNNLVKSAMKDILHGQNEDEVDRLERRRIELEHDEKIQEDSSKDVKNALLAKKEAEDKVALLKTQLSQQRKDNEDNKADLESEVQTREAQKKILDDKEQHVKELRDAAV